jgi:tRNA-splicing ligase RtcB
VISKKDFIKISDWLWEIPKSFRKDMRVPARIYVSEKMLDNVFQDKSLEQLINMTTFPGIVGYSLAMPDIHEGYGFPIGGVAAMDMESGVISPGGVGYDINCGVRLLKSNLNEQEIRNNLDRLATEIQNQVPSGLGRGRQIKLDIKSINEILNKGIGALIEKGYGQEQDAQNCESFGKLVQADDNTVSDRAKNRGRDQVGTLGSGNHFLEIQKVEQIFEPNVASQFGLFENQIVIMIHTGSRGLGHQIATDYIRIMMKAMSKYGIKLPDRELAACPIKSPEGQRYLTAMAAGANYAWANRQMISHYVRLAWKKILGEKEDLELLYDVAHNIAKIEECQIDNKKINVVVHRKGATRAFSPGHPEVPIQYRQVGQPVLVPGSMGTASYVLAGTQGSQEAFYSVCHGAGRAMSRNEAIRRFPGNQIIKDLESQGIIIKYDALTGLAEEAPLAYKDINSVVEVISGANLAKKVAKLIPLAVIKGE